MRGRNGTTLGSAEPDPLVSGFPPPGRPSLAVRTIADAPPAVDLTDGAPDTADEEVRTRLAGARILVTTMYYAPETTGSAPYTADLAEHLAACGAQVRVVTMHPHYPRWRRPEGVVNRRSIERLAGVEVVRVRGYVPHNPTLLKRALYEAVYAVRARSAVRDFAPDVVIACTPSLFAGALGARVAQRHGVACVTVVQDLVTSAAAQSGMRGAGRVKSMLSAIERWTFRHSARVTVPSATFEPAVRDLAPGAAVTVVPNWSRLPLDATPAGAASSSPELDLRDAMRRRLGWEGRFVVAHTGNMGLKQGLEDLAPALHHLAVAQPEVLVSFVGDGSRRPALEQATAGLPSAEVRDPASVDEYPLLLRAADALLVHERSTVRDMSLPSKLTSYFAAGRPVVAVVRHDCATAAEVLRSGAGVIVDRTDPTALVSVLGALQADPELACQLGDAGRDHALSALRPSTGLGRLALLISDVLADTTRTGEAQA